MHCSLYNSLCSFISDLLEGVDVNPERPSKKQSEHFLPSVGKDHIKPVTQWERLLGNKKSKRFTLTAEHCLPVWRQFARFSHCVVLSGLNQVWLMINMCSWGIYEVIVLTSILGEGLAQSTIPPCTPSVPIFPVCRTLRTLPSMCVLEGSMNSLRWPPFCGQGWRRVESSRSPPVWLSFDYGLDAMGVEFVCPLLCCERLSRLTVPVLSSLF